MKKLTAVFLMTIALAACSGGGGSNDTSTSSPSVTGVTTPGAVSVVQAN